jgi:hypothetical protein
MPPAGASEKPHARHPCIPQKARLKPAENSLQPISGKFDYITINQYFSGRKC